MSSHTDTTRLDEFRRKLDRYLDVFEEAVADHLDSEYSIDGAKEIVRDIVFREIQKAREEERRDERERIANGIQKEWQRFLSNGALYTNEEPARSILDIVYDFPHLSHQSKEKV